MHTRGNMTNRTTVTTVALTMAILLAGGCATMERTWHGIVGGQNPLVGKIWDVRRQRFISQTELVGDIDEQEFILLGEQHDNRDHHELQAEIIRALAHAGRRPKVAFEQLNPEQNAKLAAYVELQPDRAAGLGDAVGWKQAGWPDFALYEPVFQAALDAKLGIVPANLSPDEKRKVDARGLEGIDDQIFRDLDLQKGLPQGVHAMLVEEIRAGHCYKLPDTAIPRFVAMQKARDAVMAHRIAAAAKEGGAIVVTGAGHARNEWGIPHYLRRLKKDAAIATIAFVEVKPEFVKPEVYVETARPYDYLWFTPAANRAEPCEHNKAALEAAARKAVEEKPGAKAPNEAAAGKKAAAAKPAKAKPKKSPAKQKR